MPEDLRDKIYDFELMLSGFILSSQGLCLDKKFGDRLYAYWCNISDELLNMLKKE